MGDSKNNCKYAVPSYWTFAIILCSDFWRLYHYGLRSLYLVATVSIMFLLKFCYKN